MRHLSHVKETVMTSFVAEAALAIGSSVAASIIVKATVTATLALLAARLARHSRASVRHLLFAATFAILLVLPIATFVLPAVYISIAARTATPSASWPVSGSDVASTEPNGSGTNGGSLTI